MEDTLGNFRKRQAGIRKKHRRMAQGYVTKMDRNGVIIQQPDNKTSGRLGRILLFCVVFGFAFKVLLLAGLGTEVYGEKLAVLAVGSPVEQAGAWIMQVDPVTARLAELLAPFLV